MSSRARVLQLLAGKVGFQFDESELSPSLRQKIGNLANTRQQLDRDQSLIAQAESEVASITIEGKSSKTRSIAAWTVGGILAGFGFLGTAVEASLSSGVGVAGYLILFVIPGLILLLYGFLKWMKSQRASRRIQAANQQIIIARDHMTTLNASYLPQVSVMSQQIVAELSSVHESRSHPVISSAPQLVKETVLREVVMIPCSYCRGLMPQTAVFCLHCGAQRRG